jgi:hypothetical protein
LDNSFSGKEDGTARPGALLKEQIPVGIFRQREAGARFLISLPIFQPAFLRLGEADF